MIKSRKFIFTLFVYVLFHTAIFAQNTQEAPVPEASIVPEASKNFVNSIGMEFKTIPAGDFFMGYCKLTDKQKEFIKQFAVSCAYGTTNDLLTIYDRPYREILEKPQQEVFITKDFQIGVHEVTIEQFMQYAIARGDLITDKFIRYNNTSGKAPVTGISWLDIQDFIVWLNQKEGGNLYRLPTEAEWEYVARSGTSTRYSWGDNPSKADGYAWFQRNVAFLGETFPHPVGQKEPNSFGIYDMSGNVWEWVQDWFDVYYNRNLHQPTSDPEGPRYGTLKVIRGGGWQDPTEYLHSATRSAADPSIRTSVVGFRLVRILKQNELTFHYNIEK